MFPGQEQMEAEEKKRRGDKWRLRSMEIRGQLGLPGSSAEWTGMPGRSLLGLPRTPRTHNVLDTCYANLRAKNPTCRLGS